MVDAQTRKAVPPRSVHAARRTVSTGPRTTGPLARRTFRRRHGGRSRMNHAFHFRSLVKHGTAVMLCLALLAPTPAHAGILDIFSSIESTINKTIGAALLDIRTIQT